MKPLNALALKSVPKQHRGSNPPPPQVRKGFGSITRSARRHVRYGIGILAEDEVLVVRAAVGALVGVMVEDVPSRSAASRSSTILARAQ